MHALSGYLEFKEEERVETLAALRAVSDRSRRDPGCVDYWWAEDVEVPNRFHFFECWESVEAFEAHQAQPYEKEFMDRHVAADHRGRRPHPRPDRAPPGLRGLTAWPTAPTRLVLGGARVVVGDGTVLDRATVVVDGDRIASVGDGVPGGPRPDDREVELGGRTVMPGMVNCHFHATYHNLGAATAPFGLEEPVAMQVVRAVTNLEKLVRAGFTSAVSAGAPFAIDASMKQAVERRLITGPRLVPCSRDISSTGHAGDRSFPSHWEVGALGAIRRSDGPDEFRRSVRQEIKEGAEMIKVFVTGGHGTVGPREQTEVTRDELGAAIDAAHQRGAAGAGPHRQQGGAAHGPRPRHRHRRPR